MPLVPFAWGLRAAGHEVLVTASANMSTVVTEAGLPFAENTAAVQMPELLSTDRQGNPVTMPKGELELYRHFGRGYARLALRMLDGTVRLAERWQPDLVVSETYSFTGPLVAATIGVPWIRHHIRLSSPEVIIEAGAEELRPELDNLGLATFLPPKLSLDICPPSMRPAEGPAVTKMGMVPYNGRIERIPDFVFAPKQRPRVCLTFGTRVPLPNKKTIPGGLKLLQELMQALPQAGFEVVVAISDELAETMRPLPEGVLAAGQLPLSTIMPSCDLVVHHGGYGTTSTSVYLGVPQVVVPVIAEVWESIRLLAKAGVAIEVPWADASVGTVTEAASTMRDDRSYADNARGVRDEIAAMPSPADVVRMLDSL